jgi:CDP-6-deoxy-D-xylo-4-hexulose-3-dehydrase
MQQILDLIKDHFDNKPKNPWRPGVDLVQYAGPWFDHEEYQAGVESLLGGWLALADAGQRFETVFPRLYGREHGVLVNSGSSANLVMMSVLTSRRLYNFPKGTRVIVPVAGFPTTMNPIFQVGFEPVFVDMDIDTLNMDTTVLEDVVKSSGAKAMIFAHALGNCPNMDDVMTVVNKYNLILLEDACDSLGGTYDGKPLGSFGEMSSCSFYPAHQITMGEGGFVSCRTHQQEVIARSFREWGRGCYCVGRQANALKNGTCKQRFSCWIEGMPDEIYDHKFTYDEIGYNLKPIELQAAIGLVQLKKLDRATEMRRRNHRLLREVFAEYEEFFHIAQATPKADPSWFGFGLVVKDGAPFSRRDIVDYLEDKKIQTRPYFSGNTLLQPGYKHIMPAQEAIQKFPVATKLMKDALFLGVAPVVTEEQIAWVANCTEEFMKTKIK